MSAPSDRWDGFFLRLALECARQSKDPNTKVGAVIVAGGRQAISLGFNGFPRRVNDDADRLENRALKNQLTVHAELNAILSCPPAYGQRKTLYLIATDDTGDVWGGPPCLTCSLSVIQSGIHEVVSLPFKDGFSNWRENLESAKALLAEAGLEYRTVNPSVLVP